MGTEFTNGSFFILFINIEIKPRPIPAHFYLILKILYYINMQKYSYIACIGSRQILKIGLKVYLCIYIVISATIMSIEVGKSFYDDNDNNKIKSNRIGIEWDGMGLDWMG